MYIGLLGSFTRRCCDAFTLCWCNRPILGGSINTNVSNEKLTLLAFRWFTDMCVYLPLGLLQLLGVL